MKIEMPSGIGPMKTRHVEVTDQFSGRMVTAHVVICEECEDDAFHIYWVREHAHLECAGCHVSYCQAGDRCEVDGEEAQ